MDEFHYFRRLQRHYLPSILLHPTSMLLGNDIVRADSAFKVAIWGNLWSANTFPLWDPTILGGRSIVGDPIYAFLNPPSLVFWIKTSPIAFGYVAWIHVLVGSCGMYLLARRWRVRRSVRHLERLCLHIRGRSRPTSSPVPIPHYRKVFLRPCVVDDWTQ